MVQARSLKRLWIWLAFFGACSTTPAVAQRLSGVVADTAGVPISRVAVRAARETTYTDSYGQFVLQNGQGPVALRHPRYLPLDVVADGTYVVWRMTPVPTNLPVVIVAAPLLPEGFLRRRKLGTGYFIDQEQLEARRPALLTDAIRTIPGVQVYPGNPTRVRFRGAQCPPLVWLDGAPLGAGEFDIDVIQPSSLAAIELYPSNAPIEFLRTVTNSCGVIVLWTRSTTANSPF